MLQFTAYISNVGLAVTTFFPFWQNTSSMYLIAISEPLVASTFPYPAPINAAYLYRKASGSG